MLHAAISRSVPEKFRPYLKHDGIKNSFDTLERGYLIHWALDVPTQIALVAALLVTIAIWLVVSSMGDV